MDYKSGSEWRRWDLHLHTPSSYDYKDKSITNKIIVEKLIENNIEAAAITDHHHIDFERIKELNTLGAGAIHFFRGIETTTNLGGSETVHIIAIFPDDITEDKINREFLTPLYLDDKAYKDKGEKERQETYVEYRKFVDYAKNCNALISIHAGHKSNSIENICNYFSSKQKQKQDMLKEIDILETGKQKDLDNYSKIVFPDINKKLPIIVGSDNHDIKNYVVPNTWIKADITFEGLKQIKYEPELRVKIQDFNPSLSKTNTCLEKIIIKNTKMFKEKEIVFNKGLVSIIGEKGSGKTALLDIISLAYGLNNKVNSSFLLRAYDNLKTANIISKNYNMEELTSVDINYSLQIPNIEYISPVSLAKYCEDVKETQMFIDDIILDEEIKNINEELQDCRVTINTHIEILKSLAYSLSQENYETEKHANLLKNIEKQEKLRPKTHKVKDEVLKRYEDMTKQLSKFSSELAITINQHNQYVKLENTLSEEIDNNVRDLKNRLKNYYDYIDFDSLSFDIKYELPSEFIQNLSRNSQQLNNQKIELQQKCEVLKCDLEQIEKQIYTSQEALKIYNEWKAELDKLKKEKTDSEKILERIKQEKEQYALTLTSIQQEYLKTIRLKKRLLDKYKNLQTQLEQTIGNVGKTKIKLIASILIEEEQISNDFAEVINLKGVNEDEIKNNIHKTFAKQLNKLMNTDNTELKEEDVFDLTNIFIDNENKSMIVKKDLSKQTSYKGMHNKYSLLKLALNDNYININYTIQFNGMEISQLSTGQKGIVLLKLLLRLSNKTCPLLIDQPEDNLDNKSVFDELVQEFKNIKQKRQLIIATHNPNLVVNTDSEQVIIASYNHKENDGYISYISGSLENLDIKDRVCNILEGGIEAFNKRRLKYD